MIRKVGLYNLGGRKVAVYADSAKTGGSFNCAPPDGVARMDIGTDDKWGCVLGALLHEALELVMAEMGLRYRPCTDYAEDNGAYFFSLSHTQFSEAVHRVGWFAQKCLPDFTKIYESSRRHHKEKGPTQ